MPELLRKISSELWQPNAAGRRSAAALADMQVGRDKTLSVWRLSDTAYNAELQAVAVALTLERGQCAQFDYALVNEDELDDLQLTIRKSEVRTLCPAANNLHWDIVDPSTVQICELARRFGPRDPIFPREIGAMIVSRLSSAGPTRSDLTEEIEAKLVRDWGLLPAIAISEHDRAVARSGFTTALKRLSAAVDAYGRALDVTRRERATLLTAIKAAETDVERALNHARRLA